MADIKGGQIQGGHPAEHLPRAERNILIEMSVISGGAVQRGKVGSVGGAVGARYPGEAGHRGGRPPRVLEVSSPSRQVASLEPRIDQISGNQAGQQQQAYEGHREQR